MDPYIFPFSGSNVEMKVSGEGERISPTNSVEQRMFQHSTKFTDCPRFDVGAEGSVGGAFSQSFFLALRAPLHTHTHTLSDHSGYHLIRLLQLLLSLFFAAHTTSLSLEAEVVLTLCKFEAFNSVGIWLFHF